MIGKQALLPSLRARHVSSSLPTDYRRRRYQLLSGFELRAFNVVMLVSMYAYGACRIVYAKPNETDAPTLNTLIAMVAAYKNMGKYN